ncbi:hypothetical protein AB1Y20_020217 [Prymnesium parvum]|uniref:Uncharacterized protein n=1 Tax=Prymnesium parvum TaxID=97485 RepID=A0AB34JWS4_PRYPA
MAKLEAERAERASWTDAKLDREDEKFSKKHLSSRWGKEPLLPFHMVQWDPMHGLHNEFNALISEAVHEHLKIESPDKEVETVIENTKERINALWKAKNLPKYIQFGRDGKGEHSHALNGPTVKAVLRDPTLIIDTIETMAPVYALMEQGKYQLGQTVQKVKVRTVDSAGSICDAPDNKKKRGARPAMDKDVTQRKKKVRGAAFGAMESDDSDEEGEGGQGGVDETSHARPHPIASGVETDESEVSAPILPDDSRDAERAARKELTW